MLTGAQNAHSRKLWPLSSTKRRSRFLRTGLHRNAEVSWKSCDSSNPVPPHYQPASQPACQPPSNPLPPLFLPPPLIPPGLEPPPWGAGPKHLERKKLHHFPTQVTRTEPRTRSAHPTNEAPRIVKDWVPLTNFYFHSHLAQTVAFSGRHKRRTAGANHAHMNWIAPSENGIAPVTLQKRFGIPAIQFRTNSGLRSQEIPAQLLDSSFSRRGLTLGSRLVRSAWSDLSTNAAR